MHEACVFRVDTPANVYRYGKYGSHAFLYAELLSGAGLSEAGMPAPGYLPRDTGAASYLGHGGYSWSSSVNGANSMHLNFYTQSLLSNHASHRAYGFQLRCLSE